MSREHPGEMVDLGAGVVLPRDFLNDLLTAEEMAALNEHLANLAALRRRVEIEHREDPMP
jgi:hypothetical protein